MKVAVTGATGRVGRFIVEDLHRRGAKVIALRQPTSDCSGFTHEPTWIDGSLNHKDALIGLLAEADCLVHSALHHLPDRYRGGEGDNPRSFWETNLLGTLNLLEMALSQGLSRCVLLSSRAVFGKRRINDEAPDLPISDNYPLRPDTHYGALKAATEALASAYSTQSKLCVTTLRPTGVFGLSHPAHRSKWFNLALQICQPDSSLIGSTERPVDRAATEVHGLDVADAVFRLLTAPASSVAGLGFNCSDLTLSNQDISNFLQQLYEQPQLPNLKLLAKENAYSVNNPMRCDGLSNLGWKPGGIPRLTVTLRELLNAAQTFSQ